MTSVYRHKTFKSCLNARSLTLPVIRPQPKLFQKKKMAWKAGVISFHGRFLSDITSSFTESRRDFDMLLWTDNLNSAN